jgi:hypothetical protein
LGAYPLLANAFLAFGGVQKAFEGTDQVAVHFRRAWSFWPGRVHVEGARVTMQDRNVQFALNIESVDVELDLAAFARRTFHATRVRGSGVSYRFRHRIEHEALGLPFVAALPPIPEFNDPPLREFGPPQAPLDEAHYNLWTIHIEDVDVTVNELWAQMMRFEGDAHVVGAFRLRPAKRLWVGPAELEFLSGSLTTGPHEMLRGMKGKLTCKVDDFDVEPVHGMEPFRFISTRLQLAAEVPHLDAVNFLTEPSPDFDLRDGSGLLDADFAIDHGVLTPDTRLSYRTDHLGVRNPKLPFRLDGEMGLVVTGPASKPGAEVHLAVSRATLGVEKSKHRPPELRGVDVELRTSNADVTQDFPLVHSEARLDRIVLPELAWLHDLPNVLPRGWTVKEGRGHAGGVVELQQPSQAIDGSFSVGLDDAIIMSEAFKVHGTAKISGTAHVSTQGIDGSFSVGLNDAMIMSDAFKVHGTADLSGTAHVGTQGDVTVKGRALTQKVDLSTDAVNASLLGEGTVGADLALSPRGTMVGEVRTEAGEWVADVASSRFSGSAISATAHLEPTSITASGNAEKLRTSALGACPWSEAERATLAARFDTSDETMTRGGVVASLEGASLRWGGFEARSRQTSLMGRFEGAAFDVKLDASDLDMKNEGGAPRGWEAKVSSVAVTTSLAIDDKVARGPARLDILNATGQIGKTRVRGDVLAVLNLSSPNTLHRTTDVSGTVEVRNVAMATKEHDIEGWWARFDLNRTKVDMSRDFDLAGKVKAEFRDGLPALYILVSEDQIPGFVPTLFPLEGLSFDLGVERYCRWMDVQILEAHGGPLSAQGRVQIQPGETRGALLLRLAALKPISVGLHFVEDYSQTSPFVGSSWLEKRLVGLTSAATDKHDQKCIPQPPACQ